MSAETSNRDAIFCAAVDMASEADRAAYIARASGADAALRAEVEKLVAAHFRAGSFLEDPAARPTGPLGSSPPEAATPVEQPGTIIGPYKLLQLIGEGGMGAVFMAEQTQPVRRKVALKLIRPGLDGRQVVARFEAERQALALMDHPNIAKVLDAGATESGRPYFVMELVKGVPITTYCDERKLTPRQRLELFVPVCQAVQHAHQKGVIHRDLKPSNVLVPLYDGAPVPKVIDFGVAKAAGPELTEKTLYTGFGTVVGTLEYMAPEQAELNQLDIDTRSDIYSLGVLLYELLTGTTPISSKRLKGAALLEMLRLIREVEPPRPSKRLSTTEELPAIAANRGLEPRKLSVLVRGELDWIVMKCLEKERGRRYETANGLARDLERYLRDEPVQACPPSVGYGLRKFLRRNRGPALAAALVVLALVVGTAVSVWQMVRAMRAEGNAVTALADATRQRNAAQAAEREKTEQLLAAKLAEAEADRWSRRPGHAFDGLQAAAEAAQIARSRNAPEEQIVRLRNAAIACLALPDLRPVPEWEKYTPDALGAALDPVSGRYTTSDDRGDISVRRMADDAEVLHLNGPGVAVWSKSWAVGFSPDGGYLHAIYPPGEHSEEFLILVWDLRRGEISFRLTLDFPAPTVVWSQDGRRFAVGGESATILLCDVRSLNEVRRLSLGARPLAVVLDPRGKQLAILTNLVVQIRDFESGSQVAQFAFPAPVDRISWGGDGRFLAGAFSGSPDIYLYDVGAGETRTLKGHMGQVIGVGFNHTGDLLASIAWDGTQRLWDPWTGKELFRMEPDWGFEPTFSSDDRFLSVTVGMSKARRWWEVKADRAYRLLRSPAAKPVGLRGIKFSPDGRLLACVEMDWPVGTPNGIRLWDMAAARPVGFIPGETFYCFDPQGKGLLASAGPSGIRRWPLALEQDEQGPRLRIGPPDPLVGGNLAVEEVSRDGQKLLAEQPGRGRTLMPLQDPSAARVLIPDEPGMSYCRFSPDGKWVASESWHGGGAKLWDAQSGKLVRQLDTSDASFVRFSPDGRWLAVIGDQWRIWPVGSWEQEPKAFGAGMKASAFSPDGNLLAIIDSSSSVLLVDPDSGRHVATLASPEPWATDLAFSPDGSQLALVSDHSSTIYSWDLRAVRARLAAMGLDWDLPAYPPEAGRAVEPLRVRLELGDLKEMAPLKLNVAFQSQARERSYAQAARLYAEVFAAEPGLADDPATGRRYNAACAAALAGCGQGQDAPADAAERARLRQQALDWLTADLAAWSQALDKDPDKVRAALRRTLLHWRDDADLAGVRGDAIDQLPEAERPAWRGLWEDVGRTLDK